MHLSFRSGARLWVGLVLAVASTMGAHAAAPIHHEIHAVVSPSTGRVVITARMELPDDLAAGGEVAFSLRRGLEVERLPDGTRLTPEPSPLGNTRLASYRVALAPGERTLSLRYAGVITDPTADVPVTGYGGGHVSGLGVYLDGGAGWYPVVEDRLVTFGLAAGMPPGWRAVSQGERAVLEGSVSYWKESSPQDEIYLVAGRYTEYQSGDAARPAMVFLREDDPALAERYLEVTGHYLMLYDRLLGPYPYAKFALVENFWDTGYGMPSFTLLGPRVVRLPFILHSSYPHEILHNWWGNGVFVDYEGGNWSEGLTAYLADHLIKETRGEGAAYRRNGLQKYLSFVRASNDFPLTAFTARHGEASQAVGYNKTLMLFHMLRRDLGDERFVEGLRRLYREHRFRRASFDDVRKAFENVTGESLESTFRQWVERTGAPELELGAIDVEPDGDGFRLRGRLTQVQPAMPFRLSVPVAVHMADREDAYQSVVKMSERSADFDLRVPARPVRLQVDPEFDVFRRLHRDEVPPSLGELLGARDLTFVLPSSAPAGLRESYRRMAAALGGERADVVTDNAVKDLPPDRAVWLLGWNNRFLPALDEALLGQGVARGPGTRLVAGGETLEGDRHSVVLAARRPGGAPLAWVGAADAATHGALTRKLPHYTRFSYAAFTGEVARNQVRGQWTVVDSPLDRPLSEPATRGRLAPRPSLATIAAESPAPR